MSRCLKAEYIVSALPAIKWSPKNGTMCISSLTPLRVYPAIAACNACQGAFMFKQSQEMVQLCNLHALLLL